jgi:hypothetical protein
MVINDTTTAISFFPFVSFEGVSSVLVQVYHKNTKTLVSSTESVTIVGTQISMGLPNLAPINAVAQNLDTCLIRVLDDGVLLWEYLATWSDEGTNINKIFKQWDQVAPTAQQWIKI